MCFPACRNFGVTGSGVLWLSIISVYVYLCVRSPTDCVACNPERMILFCARMRSEANPKPRINPFFISFHFIYVARTFLFCRHLDEPSCVVQKLPSPPV